MKKCPHCAEQIQYDAIACRYCGRDVSPGPPVPESTERFSPRMSAILWVLGLVVLGILATILKDLQ